MSSWQEMLRLEIRKKQSEQAQIQSGKMHFPLIEQAFDEEDILAMAEVITSDQLTMSSKVKEFENKFAQFVGASFAVMVNSGSSANLLAFAGACNFKRTKRLNPGDEVLVPAVCWSTSVWPLFQFGLKPVFVDIDASTLNISISDLKAKLTSKTKGFMAVHILGNCTNMDAVMEVVKANDLILIEDTCESLGSKFRDKVLGNIGHFGTYSFYYSHHMTTGEGGMVTCQTQEDVDLLRCLRAHGWTRELSNKAELEKIHNDVDSRFLFVNLGYNLRPMEVQAALGLSQLKKLADMNSGRIKNHYLIIDALKAHPLWKDQFTFVEANESAAPVWFGFTMLLNPKLKHKKQEYLSYLTSKGVENRPVVSGNFVRQPALKELGLSCKAEEFPGAEEVDSRGFFVGIHTKVLTAQQLSYLTDTLLAFVF
jgi:dTDP-4-amino-4,6-dideoxygalactose transaminase